MMMKAALTIFLYNQFFLWVHKLKTMATKPNTAIGKMG
jgi:hypothetical protein